MDREALCKAIESHDKVALQALLQADTQVSASFLQPFLLMAARSRQREIFSLLMDAVRPVCAREVFDFVCQEGEVGMVLSIIEDRPVFLEQSLLFQNGQISFKTGGRNQHPFSLSDFQHIVQTGGFHLLRTQKSWPSMDELRKQELWELARQNQAPEWFLRGFRAHSFLLAEDEKFLPGYQKKRRLDSGVDSTSPPCQRRLSIV